MQNKGKAEKGNDKDNKREKKNLDGKTNKCVSKLCLGLCVSGFIQCSDLGVGDGQRVHPDAPATPLVFDGVVKEDAEDGVDHLCDFLLLVVSGVDVAEREHPLLPHGALQQAPATQHRV